MNVLRNFEILSEQFVPQFFADQNASMDSPASANFRISPLVPIGSRFLPAKMHSLQAVRRNLR